MKHLIFLLLLASACGTPVYEPLFARDDDVQLALRGVSETFIERGWAEYDFSEKLNSLDWTLNLVDYPGELGCPSGAIACTFMLPDEVHVVAWTDSGERWSQYYTNCPRMPLTFMHEMFHVLLYFRNRDGDPLHSDSRWAEINELELTQICSQ